MNASAPQPPRSHVRIILLVGILAALVAGFNPVRRWIEVTALLANPSATPEQLAEIFDSAPNPRTLTLTAWASPHLAQRQAAAARFRRLLHHAAKPDPTVEQALFEAAVDPDFSTRESALAALGEMQHPALPDFINALLQEPDPHLRMLGLPHLRPLPNPIAIPCLGPRIADPHPLLAALAVKQLETRTGLSFGIQLSDAGTLDHPLAGGREATGTDRRLQALQKASHWWDSNRPNFPPPPQRKLTAPLRRPLPAFNLPTLDNTQITSDHVRGKVLLIHFWATWCGACLAELPTLVELSRTLPPDTLILGVSLDGAQPPPDAPSPTAPEPEITREKVQRVARLRGMTYPILLDSKNQLGAAFRANELPTTVIVDAKGFIHRRFVGPRSRDVLAAMIEAARTPTP